jgi:hypothetical protein
MKTGILRLLAGRDVAALHRTRRGRNVMSD